MSMSLDEVYAQKKNMEETIAAIINSFQEKTGLEVQMVLLDGHVQHWMDFGETHKLMPVHTVQLEIKL